METKKIEQKGLTKRFGFGKSFYALVCGLALALAGGSYFFVFAGDLEIQTNIDNAVQTIKRIIVTSDGTSNGIPYFDLNYNGNGGAIFGQIPNGTITKNLGLDDSQHLVYQIGGPTDDGDWKIDGYNVYKTGYVGIGDYPNNYTGNLNIVSSESGKPEIYIKNSSSSPSANIHFDNGSSDVWSLGSDRVGVLSRFYLTIPGGLPSLYFSEDGNGGVNSNRAISGSLDMKNNNINNANIVTAVAFVMSSDKNLKENIQTIKNPLDKIYALNGYTFDWKKDGNPDVGLIAQEVEKVLPELVHIDTSGHKGVQYANMVALLIEGVKELGNKMDGLYNKYLDQQDQIKDLELRIKNLEENK